MQDANEQSDTHSLRKIVYAALSSYIHRLLKDLLQRGVAANDYHSQSLEVTEMWLFEAVLY